MATRLMPPIGPASAASGDLHRSLDVKRLVMMALGGAIGTGLLLGSGISVRLAGPGIGLTYAIGGLVTWLLMRALAEMTVAHPQAASFGVIAEHYVHPLAGWLVRYSYWFMQLVAIGGQITAAAIYMRFWIPQLPPWVGAAIFSAGIIGLNFRAVRALGTIEYWFAIIKVAAMVVFVALGAAVVFGLGVPGVGTVNLTAHGGLLPNGFSGVWLATSLAIFSYIGTEIVAVAAGESEDPERTVPRALNVTVMYLVAMYVSASLLLVTLAPWTLAGLGESPFVTVLRRANVAGALSITNFIVLTAALSSAVANLYVGSRMLYSLAQSGFAPAAFARVNTAGVPVAAVCTAIPILATATLANLLSPDNAYGYLLGAATFIGFFVWIMIFATHIKFRSVWRRRGEPLPYRLAGYPASTLLGLALMIGILATTWFVEGMWIALPTGAVWLLLMTTAFFVWKRKHER